MPWFVKKKLHHRCLTGFWIFLRFWIYQDSKYARVTQDSWKMLLIDAWQDSEYSSGSKYGRVLNMPGLHKVLKKAHHYRYLIDFSCQGFLSRTLTTHRTAGKRSGPSFIPRYHFHPLTNIQTFIWDDYVRWLSHIFNRIACVYQTATRLDLSPYRITTWLIDDVTLGFCLFTWWFDSSFFVTAIWDGKPVDLNSHRLSPLYYKRTD